MDDQLRQLLRRYRAGERDLFEAIQAAYARAGTPLEWTIQVVDLDQTPRIGMSTFAVECEVTCSLPEWAGEPGVLTVEVYADSDEPGPGRLVAQVRAPMSGAGRQAVTVDVRGPEDGAHVRVVPSWRAA